MRRGGQTRPFRLAGPGGVVVGSDSFWEEGTDWREALLSTEGRRGRMAVSCRHRSCRPWIFPASSSPGRSGRVSWGAGSFGQTLSFCDLGKAPCERLGAICAFIDPHRLTDDLEKWTGRGLPGTNMGGTTWLVGLVGSQRWSLPAPISAGDQRRCGWCRPGRRLCGLGMGSCWRHLRSSSPIWW